MVASIRTCRCDEEPTLSRYCCINTCCFSVPSTDTVPVTGFTTISFLLSAGVVEPGPNAVVNNEAAFPPARDTASACAIRSSLAARSDSARAARWSADCVTALLADKIASMF